MSEVPPNPPAAPDVAEQLKTMFATVVSSDLPPDEKGRWHKRLIAITNTSKRDLPRAGEQMTRFAEEWNEVQRGTENANND